MSTAPLRRSRGYFRVILPFVTLGSLGVGAAMIANVVPNEIQMPGTQPNQVSPLEGSINCESCHGQYDPAVEPYENWAGSMMAHAGRDPLFWAAMAVAERGFDGSGDLCLRCHMPVGWYQGHSTPTDGSAMTGDDFDGVTCDMCHKLTDPDASEHVGEQTAPFIAHDGGLPPEAYRGSGQAVLWGDLEKLGPYSDAQALHAFLESNFHRRSDLCGTCHDVSNPLTGDLAANNGAMTPLQPGTFDGTLGGPVTSKAALNNFPHAYGVVERTYSEHKSSPFESMYIGDYTKLPATLKQGALRTAHDAAMASTRDGNYVDGEQRNFTCQSCHMQPVTGKGCGFFFAPVRSDLPLHDLTGANYWAPDAILYLEAQNRLVGGNGLSPWQISGMQSGKLRAKEHLEDAGAITVAGNTLKLFNLTGHKLITGYAEGRRMWLNVKWFNAGDVLIREDGEYGPLNVTINAQPAVVDTLLDLGDPDTRVYEMHLAITQDWAAKLLTLGVPANLPITYDRVSGAVTKTLGQLAAQAPGTHEVSFHFALNNHVASDNRIPPYGMTYDEAVERNAQPMPMTQYGNPTTGGVYEHWDEVTLNPPVGAVRADIALMYQPTSWEYVQFLDLTNDGSVPFLATTGNDLLEAWQNTSMAAPHVMARAHWGNSAPVTYCTAKTNSLGCVPAIGWTGVPSASAGEGFVITCENVLNDRLGVVRYSLNGAAATPFHGGLLCVQSPFFRAGVQNVGGTPLPANDCSGGFAVDFNELIASGNNPALIAGTLIWAQFDARDGGFPAPNNRQLSNGLRFTIEP